MSTKLRFPFELDQSELEGQLDNLVDAVWGTLQSQFMTLPKGSGYLPYDRFASAYDVLNLATKGFRDWSLETVWAAFVKDPIVFIVIRTILGLQPPEWAYITSQEGYQVSQNQARSIDRLVRENGKKLSEKNLKAVNAMLSIAVTLLSQPVPDVTKNLIHRLDKVDTRHGLQSLQHVSKMGVPHPMLLFERFMGRPFASHRDAVSELIGEVMEIAVEDILSKNGIPYRKTKRAERLPEWDQAPDFIIPDEWRPLIAIEAKIAEDDGTARDKVARILRLRQISNKRVEEGKEPFQLIACIDGRGFGQRRQDMKDIIIATGGKVFTLNTLSYIVNFSELKTYIVNS